MDEKRKSANLKRFWEDDDVQAVFAEVKQDVLTEWEGAKTQVTREERHAEVRMLRRILDRLQAHIGSGDYAERVDKRSRTH